MHHLRAGTQELLDDAKNLTRLLLSRASIEERLHGLSPEERLRGLGPEERLRGLSSAEVARLRELLLKQEDR